MKKLIVICLMLISIQAFSQKVYEGFNENAPTFSVKFPDIDSLSYPYFSEWFEPSAIFGQTLYFSDSIYSAAANQADTLRIILEGRVPVRFATGTTYIYEQLDTIFLGANLAQQNVLSLSAFMKECRFRVNDGSTGSGTVNRNNVVAWFYLTASTTNYLRPKKSYGYLP